MAAPEWRMTHFGECFSEEAIMQADGGWWYYKMGIGVVNPVRYGGSYITTRRTISARQLFNTLMARTVLLVSHVMQAGT